MSKDNRSTNKAIYSDHAVQSCMSLVGILCVMGNQVRLCSQNELRLDYAPRTICERFVPVRCDNMKGPYNESTRTEVPCHSKCGTIKILKGA